jgi:hypothetical protein
MVETVVAVIEEDVVLEMVEVVEEVVVEVVELVEIVDEIEATVVVAGKAETMVMVLLVSEREGTVA